MINKTKKLKILFYVEYPYYFPHFIPIGKVFSQFGNEVVYILSNNQNSENMENIVQENNLSYKFGVENLFELNIDVVFFANTFDRVEKIDALTVFLEHGIGAKSNSFYSGVEYFDIYLVEGNQKLKTISELYPKHKNKLAKVGFSKFDEVINFSSINKNNLLSKYNLDSSKKTILYAPTFFPSSIEKMADNFPSEFKECNIIIKPHYLTYERKNYKKQVDKLHIWQEYENCTVLPLSEYNLVPFLDIADVMISDESSAMFEFAALNKAVVSNRYFKLRLSYYLMPWKLNQRIDKTKDRYRSIFDNANSYLETLKFTKEALKNPEKLEKKRLDFSSDICGNIDGKVSNRIYELILNKLKSKTI